MKIASTMKTMVDAVVAQESDTNARVAGVRKRRTYSKQFKTEVGTPCLIPGASVSAVALNQTSAVDWGAVRPQSATLPKVVSNQCVLRLCFALPQSRQVRF